MCVLCYQKICSGINRSCANRYRVVDDKCSKFFTCKSRIDRIVSLHNIAYDDKNINKIIAFMNSFNLVDFPKSTTHKATNFKSVLMNAIANYSRKWISASDTTYLE